MISGDGDMLVWTCVDFLTGDTAKSLELGTGGVWGHLGHLSGLAVGKPPPAVRRAALLRAGAVPRRPDWTDLGCNSVKK